MRSLDCLMPCTAARATSVAGFSLAETSAQDKQRVLKRFSRCTISLFAVLAGDAIKSVKPYFGLGVNTAFEDCVELGRCARTRWTRSRKMGAPVALGFRSWNPSLG